MWFRHSIFLLVVWFLVGVVPGSVSWGGVEAHMAFPVSILDSSQNAINQKFRDLVAANKIDELRAFIAANDMNTMDSKRVSPIHYAAYLGNVAAMRMLIQRGVNVWATVFGGWSALHYAAFGGHPEIANLLISMGVPVDIRDVGGESPLFYAVEGGHPKMVRWLVEHGANIRLPNTKNETPLEIGLASNDTEIAEYFKALLKK
ncbi:MAG: ankyrin repeat domain-containing protein [Magnetococcales bacterium]|nr:ankyrin repeat domain-containing protein [Magnetococcales bacterium]MBF0150727.1 ankyrin repeat domain-containing protein [Magnetococcales bacterium]MBF0174049.1 ankyrin repeat domain-containing protein [Magnetococcales bacterium]MBF0346044.1 ankyrin repeat domain-containing protein [Magnetococcales bacterium]MBF0631817.1 ankyrin repeat domain-containing protein [Magnetococcales bacterium]